MKKTINKENKILGKVVLIRALPNSPEQQITVENIISLVRKFIENGNPIQAEFIAKQLVVLVPKSIDALSVLALAQMNLYRRKDTVATIEMALALKGNNAETLLIAVAAYRHDQQFDKAMSVAKKAVILFPKHNELKKELELCEKLMQSTPYGQPRIAIATTLRDAALTIRSYINYHLSIGVDRFYLFFDDPDDEAINIAEQYPEVLVFRNDNSLKEMWCRLEIYPEHEALVNAEVMTRQILNLQVAINLAKEQNINWLLHIDSDELFFTYGISAKEHFQSMDRMGIKQVKYVNYEAVPERPDIFDCFKEVTLFKRNLSGITDNQRDMLKKIPKIPNLFFLFYGNGKSAAQTSQDLSPQGVHAFATGKDLRSMPFQSSKNPIILHYPCCGFDNFWKKYVALGAFSDKWFGSLDIKGAIGDFHTDSRDIVAKGDKGDALEFYKQRMIFSDIDEINQLIENDLFCRIQVTGSDYMGTEML
jgi:tetratricopeptide (TPR) repeat protein